MDEDFGVRKMMAGWARRIGARMGKLTRSAILGGFMALLAGPALAHIVTEAPWHPIAASYRTIMFLGDLKPVPWDKIQAAFNQPLPAAVGSKSAREKLLELNA